MAAKEKKGGDFILESRHLVGLFMLLVVIFAVVFTLGYLMGRSQYDAKLRAVVGTPGGSDVQAASPAPKAGMKPDAKSGNAKPESADAQLPKKNDWDFYHAAEPPKNEDHLQPPPKALASAARPPAPAAKPSAPAEPKPAAKTKTPPAPGSIDGPLIPKGTIVLQVAAVMHQEDALALAQALQQKKFPAFVLTPGTDKLYRVQVGPYPDNQAAAKAQHDLEDKGFKSIVKR